MITIYGETQTIRSPQEVFAFIGDPRNELSWHPNVRAMEKLSSGPIGEGTRFRSVYKGAGTMEFTVDTYEPPFLLEFSGSGRGFGMQMTIGIAGTGSGSRVTFDMKITPRGLLRLLQPVMQPMMRRQHAGVLAAAKRTLDGGSATLATGEAGA